MICFVRPEASCDVQERNRWIGLFYTGSSCGVACRDQWKWKDGSALSYSNWLPGHPTAGKNCAFMDSTGKWAGSSCNAAWKFVCAKGIHSLADVDVCFFFHHPV